MKLAPTLLLVVFLVDCSDDAPPALDAGTEIDAAADASKSDATPVVDASAPVCGDGVMSPYEVCFSVARELVTGPTQILEVANPDAADAILVGGAAASPRWVAVATGDETVLGGPAALAVAARGFLLGGGADAFVLGADGSIRVHVNGSAGAVAIAGPATGRTGLDVGIIAGQVNVVTIRNGSVERFVLNENGTAQSSETIAGARGEFVALLDPDVDGETDVIVGAAQFAAAVALDTFPGGLGFDGPVQSQTAECGEPCAATGMAIGEVYDPAALDVGLIVPGAIGGDVQMFLGGGTINFFTLPIAVPLTGVADAAFGLANADSRGDLAVVADCSAHVFPGVPLGTGPDSGSPLGSPTQLPEVEGHCPDIVRVADVNGDGAQEIVTGSSTDSTVVIYRRDP